MRVYQAASGGRHVVPRYEIVNRLRVVFFYTFDIRLRRQQGVIYRLPIESLKRNKMLIGYHHDHPVYVVRNVIREGYGFAFADDALGDKVGRKARRYLLDERRAERAGRLFRPLFEFSHVRLNYSFRRILDNATGLPGQRVEADLQRYDCLGKLPRVAAG